MRHRSKSKVIVLFLSLTAVQLALLGAAAKEEVAETAKLDKSVADGAARSQLITGSVSANVMQNSHQAGQSQHRINRPPMVDEHPPASDGFTVKALPGEMDADQHKLTGEVSVANEKTNNEVPDDYDCPRYGLAGAGTHISANIVMCDFVTDWKAKPWAQLRSELHGEEAHDGQALKAAWAAWKKSVNQIIDAQSGSLGSAYGHAALHIVVQHDGSLGLITDYTGHEDKFGGIPCDPELSAKLKQILQSTKFRPFPGGSQVKQCHVLLEATHYPLREDQSRWSVYNREGLAAFQRAKQSEDPFEQQRLYQQAKDYLSSALAAVETSGLHDARLAASLNNLAQASEATDDYAGALPLLERVYTIAQSNYGGGSPETASSLHHCAAVLDKMGDKAEARQLDNQARTIMDRQIDKLLEQNRLQEAQQLASIEQNIHAAGIHNDFQTAQTLYRQLRYGEAESYYKRELAYRLKVFSPQDRRVSEALAALAQNDRMLGKFQQAEALFRQALSIQSDAPNTNYGAVVGVLKHYASLERQIGSNFEATRLEQQALELQAARDTTRRRPNAPYIRENQPEQIDRGAGLFDIRF